MCGICGILLADKQPVARHLVRDMADQLRHRGPDDDGFHFEAGVGLGFRRLSIIDLDTGSQPISNEDGTVIVVFNGEIYNFQELRPALQAMGHHFKTRSDTEVIVHAYEAYGLNFVMKLRGMFAIALWDRNSRRLILARDRLGKKPLFYHVGARSLVFASEIKAILQDKNVPRDISCRAIDRYLTYRYIPGPETILREVCQLLPGHLMVYDQVKHEVTTQRYWSPAPSAESKGVSDEHLDSLLREAVRLRLISDVPLGAFLSGGIDSSIIVALMASISSDPIKTFSIGFTNEKFNELPSARLIAKKFQTIHHEYIVEPQVAELLPKLAWYADEPHGDASVLPSYYVAKMARQEVTVVLNGDGGDECFAGYRHYQSVLRTLLYKRIPNPIRRIMEPLVNRVPGRGPVKRARRIVAYSRQSLGEQFAPRMILMPAEKRLPLYRSDFQQQLRVNADEYLATQFPQTESWSPLTRMTLFDLETVLPGDLLVKIDRMSMANSLEARSPFLDHQVVETAMTLPDKDRMSWRGPNKIILRRLYGHLLPREILDRPKSGFSVPVDEWFRGPLHDLTHDILLDQRARQRDYFQTAAIQQLIDGHLAEKFNAGHALWSMVMLELWFRQFVDEK